jgi:hypothetical protein
MRRGEKDVTFFVGVFCKEEKGSHICIPNQRSGPEGEENR